MTKLLDDRIALLRPYLDDIKKWRDKTNTKTNDKGKGQSEKEKITSIIEQRPKQYQNQ